MTGHIRFLDPDGTRHGTPTFPFGMAPEHMATRRQLAEMGLRPVGDPAGQLMWRGRPAHRRPGQQIRTAALYRLADTVIRTPASPARLAQLETARAARRRCPVCHRDAGYVIPLHLGHCLDCHGTGRDPNP